MKTEKEPKSIEEFLELDLRKVNVIFTKSLCKNICKRIRKLEEEK